MPIASWDDRFADRLAAAAVPAMQQGGLLLVARIKVAINRGNRRGTNPSKPGEPPKKVTARLQKSITCVTKIEGDEVVCQIGTNVEYGRYLELGAATADHRGPSTRKAGSTRRKRPRGRGDDERDARDAPSPAGSAPGGGYMAARPFLRPALNDHAEAALRVVARALAAGLR